MADYADDFGPFDGKIWLNSASEGPLPKVSIEALHEAGEWKRKPYLLTLRRFREVPRKLKEAIGRLLHIPPEDVILGNSATYGIHLLANGLPLKKGDEVLLMQNDFPTDILPWLALEKQGIIVRQLKSQGPVLTPQELAAAVSPQTKVVCLAHVHTFSGHILDVRAIGELCRKNGIIFVLNLSQSAGCMPIDLQRENVDAVTCAAFKWLCGPYGTGFCWMTPQVRESLQYNSAYWVNVMEEKELMSTEALKLSEGTSAARYDVFGTANFFNFYPLTVSIEYLLKIGIEQVQAHIDGLTARFLKGIDRRTYDIISPLENGQRSALVYFSHKIRAKNSPLFRLLVDEGIYPAMWKGNVRIAPHIFNTDKDIDRVLEILHSYPAHD